MLFFIVVFNLLLDENCSSVLAKFSRLKVMNLKQLLFGLFKINLLCCTGLGRQHVYLEIMDYKFIKNYI